MYELVSIDVLNRINVKFCVKIGKKVRKKHLKWLVRNVQERNQVCVCVCEWHSQFKKRIRSCVG